MASWVILKVWNGLGNSRSHMPFIFLGQAPLRGKFFRCQKYNRDLRSSTSWHLKPEIEINKCYAGETFWNYISLLSFQERYYNWYYFNETDFRQTVFVKKMESHEISLERSPSDSFSVQLNKSFIKMNASFVHKTYPFKLI